MSNNDMKTCEIADADLELVSAAGIFGGAVGSLVGGIVGASVGAVTAGPVGACAGAYSGSDKGFSAGSGLEDKVNER
jgi:outer membrane lipoprotein SlyB